jgi:hypothetical protein
VRHGAASGERAPSWRCSGWCRRGNAIGVSLRRSRARFVNHLDTARGDETRELVPTMPSSMMPVCDRGGRFNLAKSTAGASPCGARNPS